MRRERQSSDRSVLRLFAAAMVVSLGPAIGLHTAPLDAAAPDDTGRNGADADRLADEILQRIQAPVERINGRMRAIEQKAASVERFQSLVRIGHWIEVRQDNSGQPEERQVTGEIWNDAIRAALREAGGAFLPARERPFYLDGPIVLGSGQFLVADARAEIRLKPGTNTCLVRNENMLSAPNGPVPPGITPDSGILVEGGIWSTLCFGSSLDNGNARGRADANDSIAGAHGVLAFNNVRDLVVRNVTVRQSRPFGVHLAAVSRFLIDGVRFERHHRDGVHLNGLCSDGVVRNVRGLTGDDFVALNAWDWRNYCMVFGPIERILVEDVDAENRGCASIRLLAGTKNFAGGATLDCPVQDCVFRGIRGVHTFKLYDQPNLEHGRQHDYADPIGKMSRLFFEQLHIPVAVRPATFQIHSDVDGLFIRDVALDFAVSSDDRLVSIGPLSQTYKHRPDDPNHWVEIFSPDKDCTVRNLRLEGIRASIETDGRMEQRELDGQTLVHVIQQQLNPDYPRTTPRGGTGKGHWVR